MNNQTKLLTGVALSFIIVYIDLTVMSVVLPTLEKVFNTTVSGILWVVNIYVLTRAALVFASGRISDIFTHERSFFFGLLVFCLASLGCGLSPNATTLIIFRCLQAVGATFLFTSGMSMITLAYPKEKRGKVIGLILSVSLFSMAVAPIVGGLFLKYLTWRWIFYINVIIGGVVFTLLSKSATWVVSHAQRKNFDWLGFFFIAVFTILLNLALENSLIWGWRSWPFILSVIIAMICLVSFISLEKKAKNPLIDLNIFSQPNFIAGSMISSLTQVSIWLILFTAIFFQNALHYSPLTTGYLLAPLLIVGVVSSNVGGFLVDRFGVRLPLIIGTGASFLGVLVTILLYQHITYTKMLPMLILTGVGMFMVNGPIRAALLNQTTKDKYGMVNSTLNGLRGMGGAIGFAILSAVLISVEFSQVKVKLLNVTSALSDNKIHKLLGLLSNTPGSLNILKQFSLTVQNTIHHVISAGYLQGFYWMLLVLGTLMLINFLLSIFYIRAS